MTSQTNENMKRLQKLKGKLEHIPQKPGVYIHKNTKDEILYVGKAKNLKARLKSYFTAIEQQSPKTRALVEKIYDYEVIVTENEYESLLLENNLIKHNLPPYNILLRDDKTYPYIKIDKNEEWPRVILTRRRKKDGALYFGPYTILGQVYQILNVINRFFPLIKCTPTVFKTVSRPCNYYDVKKCLGPCKLPINKIEYNNYLEQVIDILNGNISKIIKKLKEEMQLAAKNLNYEKAAMLRDQYKALENLNENQSVTLDLPIYLDVINFCWNDNIIVFYITFIRSGKLVGGNSFVLKDILYEPNEDKEDSKKEQIISSFICQYYIKKEIPDFIFLGHAQNIFTQENLNNLNKYLYEQKKKNTITPKGSPTIINENEKLRCSENTQGIVDTWKDIFITEESILLKKIKVNYNISEMKVYKKIFSDLVQLSLKNAENKYQEVIKIDENATVLLNDLKNLLELNTLPRHIECFDISTFQGSQSVASQVTFKDGLSYKSGYRKYIIKETPGKTDDFASLREVMRRRFKQQDSLPDLIVIDGGSPQIREVGWTLKSLGLEYIPFIGLAKSRIQNHFHDTKVTSSQERVIIPRREKTGELLPNAPSETIILKEGSPSFRLLTQLRDEAHRFAIQFHRQKRDKASLKSFLIDIPGLGAKRRKQLLELCPDLTQIKTTNLNELGKKTKIPLNILIELKEKLSKV